MTIIILTALFVYVMPSNFTFILVLLWFFRKDKHRCGYLLIIGTCLGFMLYLPVIEGMMNDLNVAGGIDSLFNLSTITHTMPQTLNAFMSYRYLLIIPAVWGWCKWYKYHKKYHTKTKMSAKIGQLKDLGQPKQLKDLKYMWLYIAMFTVPFFIFAVQGSHLYHRVMFPALPFFCLFLSQGIKGVMK